MLFNFNSIRKQNDLAPSKPSGIYNVCVRTELTDHLTGLDQSGLEHHTASSADTPKKMKFR